MKPKGDLNVRLGMTLVDIEQAHAALLVLLDTALHRPNTLHRCLGICYHWNNLGVRRAYELVNKLCLGWQHCQQDVEFDGYPVPDDHKLTQWEGVNLAYRVDLIRYMLKRLRDWRRRARAAKRSTKVLREALAVYDAGNEAREDAWAMACSNEAMAACEAADREALRLVQLAFYEVTSDRNSRDNCLLVGIDFMRRIATLDRI